MAASVDQVGGGVYSLCEVRWRVAYRWGVEFSCKWACVGWRWRLRLTVQAIKI